ncbi:MAG: glycerol-3-phosphate acyltransferase [Verrucomicrobia bacterium]|nr:glycerol-3-phosphate acyltransferase [Verrucomicrobiota bacterium]
MAWMEQLQAANGAQALVCALGAYLLGCFATGYYLVRAVKGQDIRNFESGSVGARNVGRLLGRTAFFLTVAGDLGKGVLAVWAADRFTDDPLLPAVALLCVVAGHIWPVQLRFHGGKGVAASLGALLLYDHRLAVAYAVFFLCGFALIRRTLLPGLFAFACLPLTEYWLHRDGLKLAVIALLAAMILFAHRKNLLEEIPALAARRSVTAKPHHPKL